MILHNTLLTWCLVPCCVDLLPACCLVMYRDVFPSSYLLKYPCCRLYEDLLRCLALSMQGQYSCNGEDLHSRLTESPNFRSQFGFYPSECSGKFYHIFLHGFTVIVIRLVSSLLFASLLVFSHGGRKERVIPALQAELKHKLWLWDDAVTRGFYICFTLPFLQTLTDMKSHSFLCSTIPYFV